MSRNGNTIPLPSAFAKLPESRTHSGRDSPGSRERTYARTSRGYSRCNGGTVVDDAPGAEPEGGELRVPDLRRHAARDERARTDRAGRRRLEAPPRAPGVRRRGPQARGARHRGRV